MKPLSRSLSALALAVLSAASVASTTTYSSSASFLGNVAAGAYFESYDGLVDPPAGPALFSGSGFSYSAFAPSDIYLAGGFLSTSQISEALTITFTSGNVTAVGGNFYIADLNDDFQSVSVTLTLSDGTTTTFTPTSMFDSYRGFTSDLSITSLTMSGPGPSLYAGLDNLTVGVMVSPVPEPATLSLLGLGLTGLLVTRRRRI